ncbi:MAG TPA: glutamate racemase [Thermodesulfobacteriota bacterium]
MERQPIGILDSGVGGLAVARAILDRLPGEAILYYADTAHFPYGERTLSDVRALCVSGIRRLASLDAACVVVACNTAAASSLDDGAPRVRLPVFDVLSSPVLAGTLRRWHGARLGLVATPLTVASGAYQAIVEHFARPRRLAVVPTARLARIVEGGAADAPKAADAVRSELAPLLGERLDALILGCTHFGFLEAAIRAVVGPDVAVIDPARLVARGVADALETAGLARREPAGAPPRHRLVVTGGRADEVARAAARLGIAFERCELGEDAPRGAVAPAGEADRPGVGLR